MSKVLTFGKVQTSFAFHSFIRTFANHNSNEMKTYNKPFDKNESVMANEPLIMNVMNNRNDINRAITGDELLNRLRPRIKSLFR